MQIKFYHAVALACLIVSSAPLDSKEIIHSKPYDDNIDYSQISEDGWGPVKIGMTLNQISVATGKEFVVSPPLEDEDYSCQYWQPKRQSEFPSFLAQNGRLSVISISSGSAPHDDYVQTYNRYSATLKGIRLGDSIVEVRAAYPQVKIDKDYPHSYRYLVWDGSKKRGLMFYAGNGMEVTRIDIGNGAIELFEGCY